MNAKLAAGRRLLVAGLVVAGLGQTSLAGPAAAQQEVRRPKKFIATGWDHPDSQRLRENLAEMEKRPFDGVVVQINGRVDEKRRCPLRRTFPAEKWRREWFQPCVENLKACKFTRFTDNFLLVGANPGDVDWFDDAGWGEIVDHWRIAAQVARTSGFRGLVFDPEPYTPPHAQFKYAAQPQRPRHAFEDYRRQARRRGREVMRAVTEEYPDITLFSYFMNSVVARAADHADPNAVLKTMTYGLLPAFLDGWLDVAGPGVTFVDGCEHAYRYNSDNDYLEAAVAIKGACQGLVSPANRPKYRAAVQVSFGLYLDAYWNPKDSQWGAWYVDGLGRPRVDRLRINAQTALRVADEYVWVYGEKFRWWPTPNRSVREQTWPQALPGSEGALAYVRDPVGYARGLLAERRQADKLTNLARNGDFGAAKDSRPEEWSAWQEETSKGTFSLDGEAGADAKGAARAAGVSNGCFVQRHDVRPGERYAVRAMRKLAGGGDAWVRIRWQTAEGAWIDWDGDSILHAAGPRENWREAFGVVEVPESAGKLVILLGAGDQPTDRDAAWFDDVGLYALD